MCSVGVHPGWTCSASNQPSHAGSNFGDGSEPLFSIYSKTAEKEDNKLVERWQRDAQGILIFVSLRVAFRGIALMECSGCFVLYRRRNIGHHIGPGPQTTLTGRLRILSPEHISASRQPKCI